MAEQTARVWAEEIDPPTTWRYTWQLEDDDTQTTDDQKGSIVEALGETEGVVSLEDDGDGLIVVIDPEVVTRYELAARVREALGAKAAEPAASVEVARVWAEDLAEDRMRITWQRVESEDKGQGPLERRRVAAWLAVMPGIRSVSLDTEGALVRYQPDLLRRAAIGPTVRDALSDDIPLRKRADDLMHRAPTYGNLARKLAMDDRVSPLPEAAKQAVASRRRGGTGGAMARTTAMRFIPGAAMISRIQTLLPVLQELSTWSRNADPAIVEEHLASVGLTREMLHRDTITAQEIRFHARDFASEATAEISDRAAKGARRAFSTGREVLASVRESVNARTQEAPDAPAGAEPAETDEDPDKPTAE